VPRSGGAPAEPPKPKEKLQRPAGMSREAFALLDGAHPVVPAALAADLQAKGGLAGLKEKRKSGPPKGQARRPAPAPATTVRRTGAGPHTRLITRLGGFAIQRRLRYLSSALRPVCSHRCFPKSGALARLVGAPRHAKGLCRATGRGRCLRSPLPCRCLRDWRRLL
jgi:hypothetical protein